MEKPGLAKKEFPSKFLKYCSRDMADPELHPGRIRFLLDPVSNERFHVK
jgi:hypothetical protein